MHQSPLRPHGTGSRLSLTLVSESVLGLATPGDLVPRSTSPPEKWAALPFSHCHWDLVHPGFSVNATSAFTAALPSTAVGLQPLPAVLASVARTLPLSGARVLPGAWHCPGTSFISLLASLCGTGM